ncbi:FAD-binding oxidoreductase [Nocardia sp. NPDC048505]|uniref:FAD-dependent oxidoreductase n=1 Tax=unclassified Nocardia TaxID=2637762 RepID=UPI0033FB1D07
MAKQLFDPRFDAARPAAVVRAANVDDVRAAVAFANEQALPVAVRGGGHSYVGASAADGAMVVDLRLLNEIGYDAGSAVIGAGASVIAVQQGLAPFGQTLPLGTCPTVGIAGLALGGGVGVDSRLYGLTCDRLTAATLVLADGSVEQVSATRRPELFWALRGGGAGLGVVTSLTFRTCPTAPKDIVRLSFPGATAEQVLTGWARWLPDTGRSAWASVELSVDDAGAITSTVLLVCAAGTGTATAARLAGIVGAAPGGAGPETLDHAAAVLRLGGGRIDTPRTVTVAGSDVLREVTPESAAAVAAAAAELSTIGGQGMVLVDPLDGAVRDIPADATACPWRAHGALLQWLVADPDSPDAARGWIDRAHHSVARFSAGGYSNYLEADHPAERYLAGNAKRWNRIRAEVDPHGRFAR